MPLKCGDMVRAKPDPEAGHPVKSDQGDVLHGYEHNRSELRSSRSDTRFALKAAHGSGGLAC